MCSRLLSESTFEPVIERYPLSLAINEAGQPKLFRAVNKPSDHQRRRS
jgi:hypothetical protein